MKKIFLMSCILSFTMLFASCSKDEKQIPSSTGAVTLDQVEKLDEQEPISEKDSLKFYRSPNEEYIIAFPEEVEQTGGTEDYGDEYEKVDGEILKKYKEIEQSGEEIKIIDLKRMENEIINLQLYEIMDMTEENMYIVQESPLSVCKMILYGLTTQPVVLEATVYDKEAKLSALKEYIPDFQGQIAKKI